jgi:hypothetical protein
MPFFDNQSRSDLRSVYLQAWRKRLDNLPLEPLEAQIAAVIEEHPEYQHALQDADAVDADYAPGGGRTNPFLHMGMHLAIRDQIATDRPAGIRAAFQRLARRSDAHAAEHAVAEHLAEMLWQAQRSGLPPDEQVYLRRVERMTR